MLDTSSIPDAPPEELRFTRSSSVFGALRELWGRRELIRTLTTRDFIARYKQTLLGVGWSVIQPLAVVLALSLFLRRIAKADTHGVPYVLWSFVGLIPWSFFSGAVTAGVNSLLNNQPLLNKVRCPREAFPFAAVLPLLLQLGLFVTPIAFALDQVPPRFRLLYCFVNPVAPVIDSYRRVVLYGIAPQPGPLLAGALSGILLFLIGVKVFKRLELGIADLI